MALSTFLLYKRSALTEIKWDLNLIGKQHFMAIYSYLLEFAGLMFLKFYLLKHSANVYQQVLKKLILLQYFIHCI